jgi:hypothetical protein
MVPLRIFFAGYPRERSSFGSGVPKGGLDRLSRGHPGQRPLAARLRAVGLQNVALLLPIRSAPEAGSSPHGAPDEIKKEPTDFSGLLRISSGAEGGTRTPTGFPTTPSRWRVCQFHHFGTLRKKHTSDAAPENQGGETGRDSGRAGSGSRSAPENDRRNVPLPKPLANL